MTFWFYDKLSNTPAIFGSLVAIDKNTDIGISKLNTHFSIPINKEAVKNGLKNGIKIKKEYHYKYVDERYEIYKLPIIRSKHEKKK